MTAERRLDPQRLAMVLLKIAVAIAAIVAINHGMSQVKEWLDLDIRPSNEDQVHRAIMIAAAVYALSLAIPFVPGVEIGLGLIALLGAKIVPLVYLCTVAGLMIAFLVGRLVPLRFLIALARDLHLARVEALLNRFDAQAGEHKLTFLLNVSKHSFLRTLLRHRYIALALAVNMPGNFVIGGGGGIALLCGISRLFSPPLFLVTIILAVSPVPLLVLVLGPSVLAH